MLLPSTARACPLSVSACREMEALLLAMLDGHHALYKVGARLEDRGMGPLLQPGLSAKDLSSP